MNIVARSFEAFVESTKREFMTAPIVEAPSWQSTAAPMPMVELLNKSFTLDLRGEANLDYIRRAIKPNLPWADNHFEQERVSGEPINPGETWKQWPYAASAAKHLREGENIPQYDHSYAERYWPKYAGLTSDGKIYQDPNKSNRLLGSAECGEGMRGIRFPIGDLEDLVQVLIDDPLTRQAYLPIFYPEDVGAALLRKRVPCTLGYHFIRRPIPGTGSSYLHIVYPMRSCDFVRHFRDDVYLTIRLLLWVLEQCQDRDLAEWNEVYPGTFRMHITSLHMFKQDRENLRMVME